MAMTFADLRQMLRTDVNRTDKEPLYPVWINRALRAIQTDNEWEIMRDREDVVINAGDMTANLPANFKELTAEQYPVTVIDTTQSPTREIPAEVTSREKILTYYSSSFMPPMPAYAQGRMYGLPLWIEQRGGVWTINTAWPFTPSPLTLRVSYYGFLDDLVKDSDTNWFLANYPEMVENRIKEIAFSAINDPIAGTFAGVAASKMGKAKMDDTRRKLQGRVLRMGG